jgi:uncharacterized protein with NAD-binding domain and iron-sulfur cluster
MKRRIAVLGGGVGSMTTVWALTHLPDWQEKFDITIYQLGWRLGGKGASGRDPENSWRILEHGLHVWGGFYENAFRAMQQVYAELPSDTGNPLQSWTGAFRKLSTVILQEDIGGRTLNWQIDFPENNDVPGTGGVIPTPWHYLELIINALRELFGKWSPPPESTPLVSTVAAAVSDPAQPQHVSIFRRLFEPHYEGKPQATLPPSLHDYHSSDLLVAAHALHQSLPDDPKQHAAVHHDDLIHLLEEAIKAFTAEVGHLLSNDNVRRVLLLADFIAAIVRGILRDGVLIYGWEVINDREWRDWLYDHCASEATIDSAIVRGIYDYVFGFVKGVPGNRQLEAGTGTYGVLRLFFTFKGAIFWEMQAGMGDIVFAPMYRVLKARGVKFVFFSKVMNLGVENGVVESITIQRQATVKAGEDAYDPLIVVNNVHAWPSQPRYAQLEEGESLAAYDLESAWTPWEGVPPAKVLKRGTDFDDVVLGISLAAARHVATEVAEANADFALMLQKVRTVGTASMQLWLDADAGELGAPLVRRAATAAAEPLATWSDMSFLLAREQWPPDYAPRYLAYFCGELEDPAEIAPFTDHDYPAEMMRDFRAVAVDWLRNNTGSIWSKATLPGGPCLDWNLLHDPQQRSGEARLDAQFFRVNIDPTERYVTSFPGTSQYRMRADRPVLSNLFITGDWVRTPFNAGCVEAAVIAGLYAARAVSGEHIDVIGG